MKNHLILQSKMWTEICKIVEMRACSSGFDVVPVQLPAVLGLRLLMALKQRNMYDLTFGRSAY